MNKKILCIIPCRSGSKSIPHKNIKQFGDKPLIAWTIEQIKSSKYIDNIKVIVSTDDKHYAKIANNYGAETPFLRPKEISGDLSTDFEFIKHSVEWLKENENYNPDMILQLRVTCPFRKTMDIDKALEIFINNYDNYDSLRSVYKIDKTPYKLYKIKNNILIPYLKSYNNLNEPFNNCRQIFPNSYQHNGYIDILKTELLKDNKISGENIFPFIMKKECNIDIDTMDDWHDAEKNINIYIY